MQDSKEKTATQTLEESSESTSRLSDVAQNVEVGLNGALNALSRMYFNVDSKGKVLVNKDFNSYIVDGNVITALNNTQLAGNLSTETLLKSLVRGEVIDVDSVDGEIERINSERLGLKPLEE